MANTNGILVAVYLLSFVFEICLAVVAFLVVRDVFGVGSLAWTIVEAIAFLVNLALWMLVAFVWTPGTGRRGGALFRADAIYFVMATAIHFALLVAWIIFQITVPDGVVLTWDASPAETAVYRDNFQTQFVLEFMLVAFTIFDVRTKRLRDAVLKRSDSVASSFN